jgi:hypothetical protein
MVLALGLWWSRGLVGSMQVPLAGLDWVRADLALWSRPAPLFILAIVLSACGVWLAGTREHRVRSGA